MIWPWDSKRVGGNRWRHGGSSEPLGVGGERAKERPGLRVALGRGCRPCWPSNVPRLRAQALALTAVFLVHPEHPSLVYLGFLAQLPTFHGMLFGRKVSDGEE